MKQSLIKKHLIVFSIIPFMLGGNVDAEPSNRQQLTQTQIIQPTIQKTIGKVNKTLKRSNTLSPASNTGDQLSEIAQIKIEQNKQKEQINQLQEKMEKLAENTNQVNKSIIENQKKDEIGEKINDIVSDLSNKDISKEEKIEILNQNPEVYKNLDDNIITAIIENNGTVSKSTLKEAVKKGIEEAEESNKDENATLIQTDVIPDAPNAPAAVPSLNTVDDIINYLSNKNIDKELKQGILKSYPEIKKIVGEKNIDNFLNGTIPFPPDVRNAIAKRINPNAELLQVPSDVQILNQPIANAKSKLKDIDKTKFNEAIAGNQSTEKIDTEKYVVDVINSNPNLSLKEKQDILAEYPELIERIGAEKVKEYLKNNVPLPYIPPAPDELAAVPDLTNANGILNYLSNPNIPEVNKKIVLKNYPEIEQIVKQQGGDINDYLNNTIPFTSEIQDAVAKKLQANSVNSQSLEEELESVKNKLRATPVTGKDIEAMWESAAKLPKTEEQVWVEVRNARIDDDKISKSSLDSSDLLQYSDNLLKLELNGLEQRMVRAKTRSERSDILKQYPELKKVPGIASYLNTGKVPDLSYYEYSQLSKNELVKRLIKCECDKAKTNPELQVQKQVNIPTIAGTPQVNITSTQEQNAVVQNDQPNQPVKTIDPHQTLSQSYTTTGIIENAISQPDNISRVTTHNTDDKVMQKLAKDQLLMPNENNALAVYQPPLIEKFANINNQNDSNNVEQVNSIPGSTVPLQQPAHATVPGSENVVDTSTKVENKKAYDDLVKQAAKGNYLNLNNITPSNQQQLNNEAIPANIATETNIGTNQTAQVAQTNIVETTPTNTDSQNIQTIQGQENARNNFIKTIAEGAKTGKVKIPGLDLPAQHNTQTTDNLTGEVKNEETLTNENNIEQTSVNDKGTVIQSTQEAVPTQHISNPQNQILENSQTVSNEIPEQQPIDNNGIDPNQQILNENPAQSTDSSKQEQPAVDEKSGEISSKEKDAQPVITEKNNIEQQQSNINNNSDNTKEEAIETQIQNISGQSTEQPQVNENTAPVNAQTATKEGINETPVTEQAQLGVNKDSIDPQIEHTGEDNNTSVAKTEELTEKQAQEDATLNNAQTKELTQGDVTSIQTNPQENKPVLDTNTVTTNNQDEIKNPTAADLQIQQPVENNRENKEKELNNNGGAEVKNPNEQVLDAQGQPINDQNNITPNEQNQASNEKTNINPEDVKNDNQTSNNTEKEADDYHDDLNNLFYPEGADKSQTTPRQDAVTIPQNAIVETQHNIDNVPAEETIADRNISTEPETNSTLFSTNSEQREQIQSVLEAAGNNM